MLRLLISSIPMLVYMDNQLQRVQRIFGQMMEQHYNVDAHFVLEYHWPKMVPLDLISTEM